MSLPLILRPAAEADVEDTYRWYESQNAGLGSEFLRAAEAKLAIIERQPNLYPEYYQGARRALLRRFPYAIYYVIQPAIIEVIGCFHVRRHPRRWRSRL